MLLRIRGVDDYEAWRGLAILYLTASKNSRACYRDNQSGRLDYRAQKEKWHTTFLVSAGGQIHAVVSLAVFSRRFLEMTLPL